MLFQYIGDKKSPPAETIVFGHSFQLGGEPVDVKDSRAIKKLKAIATFQAVEGKTKAAEAAKLAAEKVEAEKAAAGNNNT